MTEAFAHRVDTLRAAQRGLEDSQRQVELMAKQRDRLVHTAVSVGMTHAEISRATGLTRARIGQIALQAPKEKS